MKFNAWLIPLESTANTVDLAVIAALIPESAAVAQCTVASALIVVTVIRAEHHIVVVTERITNVTRVPGHQQPVVVRLTEYNEGTVLGPVPAVIA